MFLLKSYLFLAKKKHMVLEGVGKGPEERVAIVDISIGAQYQSTDLAVGGLPSQWNERQQLRAVNKGI